MTVDQSSERGKFHVELSYTTDGKECTNEIMGTPVKTTVKWDGNALVFHTAGSKVLTINRHLKSADRERDQKIVFEKQVQEDGVPGFAVSALAIFTSVCRHAIVIRQCDSTRNSLF